MADIDEEKFFVVINIEEQYSIWPAFKDMPLGWTAIGEAKTKKECLDYIEAAWTDMRPLSLRKAMEDNRT
jgi:MbtH protein